MTLIKTIVPNSWYIKVLKFCIRLNSTKQPRAIAPNKSTKGNKNRDKQIRLTLIAIANQARAPEMRG